MRKLAVFALPYCAAVAAAQYLLPRSLWLAAGALCALFSLTCLLARGARRLRTLLIALGLAAGFFWCRGYDTIFYAPAEALNGRTVDLDARVTDWPRPNDYGVSVAVRLVLPDSPDVQAVLYADDQAAQLRPGDRISVIGACRLSQYTGSGQETDYYTSRGIFLAVTAYGELSVTSPSHTPIVYWSRLAARAVSRQVEALFPRDSGPLMLALLMGRTDGLEDSLYANLRRTGLAHTVAVSGMHISFLAGLLQVLPTRRRRLRAGVSMAAAFLFSAVTGNSPSALRAAFQCAYLQVGPLLGREEDTPTALSAVLLGLLVQNPRAVTHVGLQLSFAAVAGIYLFGPRLSERLTRRLPSRRWWAGLVRLGAGVLATTLGAMVFTIPLSAWHFGAVSLISPVANLLVYLPVLAAFLLGLAAVGLSLVFPGLGFLAALGAALPVRYITWVADTLGAMPFAAVKVSSVYYALWLLFCYGVLCLHLLWRGQPRRPWVPLAACGVVLWAAVLFTGLTITAGELTVTVLDVGQGQSIVLASGGELAVVDCGGNKGDSAGDIAADSLQSAGHTTLKLLVFTHFHDDHADGAQALMTRIKVETVAMPVPQPEDELAGQIEALALAQGARLLYITQETQLSLGQSIISLYPPLEKEGENERGICLLATAGDFDVLVTGDINEKSEALLLSRYALPDIELLVAGHHGSKYSTSEELLNAVTPELAVLSVGRNTYGHPTQEVLGRLGSRGVELYRTDLQGTVTVTARH